MPARRTTGPWGAGGEVGVEHLYDGAREDVGRQRVGNVWEAAGGARSPS